MNTAKRTRKTKPPAKRVALLCPGPSLIKTWIPGVTGDEYDHIIGVNRAVLHDRCTHWAFTDPDLFIDHRPNYRPVILHPRLAERKIDRAGLHDELYRHNRQTTDDMDAGCPRALSWTLYTVTAAMVYAHTLGAVSIDLYGNDRAGVEDFDGHTGESDNRTQQRWSSESIITANVTAWLNKHGVAVDRIRITAGGGE